MTTQKTTQSPKPKQSKRMLKLRVGTLTENYAIDTEVTIDVVDLKDAREKWLEFLNTQDYDRYTIGGDVFEGDEVIAIFSPNGRCWKPGTESNEFYKRLKSDEEIIIT